MTCWWIPSWYGQWRCFVRNSRPMFSSPSQPNQQSPQKGGGGLGKSVSSWTDPFWSHHVFIFSNQLPVSNRYNPNVRAFHICCTDLAYHSVHKIYWLDSMEQTSKVETLMVFTNNTILLEWHSRAVDQRGIGGNQRGLWLGNETMQHGILETEKNSMVRKPTYKVHLYCNIATIPVLKDPTAASIVMLHVLTIASTCCCNSSWM